MKSVEIWINDDYQAKRKFDHEGEFESHRMDTKIHRFPAGLGAININYSYVIPRVVAIGPYHHGKEHLMEMEEVKKAAAYDFCQRMGLHGDSRKKAYEAVHSVVGEACGEYIGDYMKNDDANFAAMMFRDACFLLLYMNAYSRSSGADEDDEVDPSLRRFLFSKRDSIDNDIMLLENQLPWLVVQVIMGLVDRKIYLVVGKFIAGMGNTFKIRESLLRETYLWDDEYNPPPHLLGLLRRHKTEPGGILVLDDENNPPHHRTEPGGTPVLDDENNPPPLRISLLQTPPVRETQSDIQEENPQPPQKKKEENPKVTSISAMSPMEVEEIGIQLTASKTDAFSDMAFVKVNLWGELSMAPLSLSDARASCLVNMAAFEVCTASRYGDDPNKTAVCSYLALLDMFMVRDEDVHRLRSKGILHGPHSNKEMLTFFKTVVMHLPDSGSRFAHVMAQIEDYKRKRYIWIKLYRWIYNNYITIIKVVSFLVTLIGLYRAVLSLTKN